MNTWLQVVIYEAQFQEWMTRPWLDTWGTPGNMWEMRDHWWRQAR